MELLSLFSIFTFNYRHSGMSFLITKAINYILAPVPRGVESPLVKTRVLHMTVTER